MPGTDKTLVSLSHCDDVKMQKGSRHWKTECGKGDKLINLRERKPCYYTWPVQSDY